MLIFLQIVLFGYRSVVVVVDFGFLIMVFLIRHMYFQRVLTKVFLHWTILIDPKQYTPLAACLFRQLVVSHMQDVSLAVFISFVMFSFFAHIVIVLFGQRSCC